MTAGEWLARLERDGWVKLPFDEETAIWAAHALPHARASLADPEFEQWHRSEGTWFVGVNALNNDEDGVICAGPQFPETIMSLLREITSGPVQLDKGQVSAVFRGFPKQGDDSDAAFRFRRNRDGAHVDGLHKVDDKRVLRETHAFLLGIPLTETGQGASPVVIWQGSHAIMRNAFQKALAGFDASGWDAVDMSDVYSEARRRCFDECERIELHATPGEAYLIHRLALHGVSPWQEGATAGADGRMVAYFRPELENKADWLA